MVNRTCIAALLTALVWIGACASPDATPEDAVRSAAARPRISEDEATRAAQPAQVARFSKDNAMEHVRALASRIGIRERATRGERRGARYIAQTFESYGYQVHVQKFAVDGATSRNVVAWWPGARRYPVVLGGHMDSVPGSPGANDNASGIAVLLELARAAAGTEQVMFVRFVAFGSEEFGDDGRHHVGSQTFVDRLGSRGRRRLAGMLSVDMIADGRPLLTGTSGIASEVVARTFYRKATDLGIDMRYQTTCDCSDNGPFEHAGIPAAYVWSGSEPDYHSPSDIVANMSPDDLMRTGRAVRALLVDLGKELLDRFRRG